MDEYDKLTGLYTREAFCYHAEQRVKNNPEQKFDIVLSDFINFKHFNSRYGTEAGDWLLLKTGEMLSMDGNDAICGRYGADRFVSIVPHMDEAALSNLENFQLPEQAKDELPVFSIVVKFGVCADIDHNMPISVSCDRAYMAVQSVKHQYGRNLAVYDDDLGKAIHQELIIEENMKSALENNQFHVYYQPKMDISSETICGAEALVRWIHPTLGFMNPGIFIPLFEKNGFITSMDLFIWEQVCRDLSEWRDKGIALVPVSVNISRKDFNLHDLSDRIIHIVDWYHIDHSLFHLEVTESSYAENAEDIMKHINILHEAGFVIELDDFGSGYTSLSTLNDMNIDILKLDISLLQKDKPDSDRSVLNFAMQLARMMKLRTIQEGVETKEQLERLKALGCDCIQGYYYSKPLTKNQFEDFLTNRQLSSVL